MKNSIKWVKLILGIVAVIFIVGVVSSLGIKHERTVNSTKLTEEFKKISELATYKNMYTESLFIKDSKTIKSLKLPFTTKRVLVKYDGYVKAGIDLKDADIHVNNEKNSVKIKLSKSKILDNVVDTESLVPLDQEDTIFNEIKLEEVFAEINNNKQKTVESLINRGFLEEADKNAKILLESFLKGLGFEEVEIEIS